MVEFRHAGVGRLASRELGHYGVPETGLTMVELTIVTAWNVHGDATRPDFVLEARRLFDLALPAEPNTTARSDTLIALWLGPRSWLLVGGGPSTLTDFPAKRDALNQLGGALFDVSASRVAWALAGPRATDVLAKACPLDFHRRAFSVGACAQSVFGHVNMLVDKRDETPTFTLMVARSFARDVWRTLCLSAAQYGYDAAQPTAYR